MSKHPMWSLRLLCTCTPTPVMFCLCGCTWPHWCVRDTRDTHPTVYHSTVYDVLLELCDSHVISLKQRDHALKLQWYMIPVKYVSALVPLRWGCTATFTQLLGLTHTFINMLRTFVNDTGVSTRKIMKTRKFSATPAGRGFLNSLHADLVGPSRTSSP